MNDSPDVLPRWEVRHYLSGHFVPTERDIRMLTALGKSGWELVSSSFSHTNDRTVYMLKRPLCPVVTQVDPAHN